MRSPDDILKNPWKDLVDGKKHVPLPFLAELEKEYEWAAKNGKIHSAHEGFAIMKEELDELWDVIKSKHQDKEKLREEALHVAVTAIRFLKEVCKE